MLDGVALCHMVLGEPMLAPCRWALHKGIQANAGYRFVFEGLGSGSAYLSDFAAQDCLL